MTMMETSNTSTQYVTAFFDSRRDADAAIERVAALGVPHDDIRIVEGNERAAGSTVEHEEDKGFFEALKDFFMPDDDRHTYAEGLNRGGYLVSINTSMEHRDRIVDILDDEGTVDMDEREATWRADGWEGYRTDASETGHSTGSHAGLSDNEAIPIVREEIKVGKREVEAGRVRVRSYVVETPVEENVALRDESVHVERRPVDRPVTDADEAVFADRTVEARETREEAVVSKDARVTEEVTVDKDVNERTETVTDTVRHTEVDVDDDRTTHKRK